MLTWPMEANPIWQKSVRARLRLHHWLSWGVVTLTLTTFICLIIYLPLVKRGDATPAEAATAVIPAILIIQSVLLMMFGTGATAHGVAEERDEKLLDYQRMTPMSPTQKIVGYLFGLPAREYMLVGLTMPFLITAVIVSGFSVLTLLHFYMVFFLSTWVYHMTGLMAGMVWPKPRLAVFLSMGMVALLYFVLPNLSRLGITFFEHLTIRPTLFGLVWEELPERWRPRAEMSGIDSFRDIPWFGGMMHPTLYTVFVQVFVLGTMYSVVHRKWKRENSHLFSKAGGLVVFGGVVMFMLSSLWAMVAQDEVYWDVFGRIGQRDGVQNPSGREPEMLMVLLIISMGLVGGLYLLMTTWVTAGRHTAVEGWRRAKKRGDRGLGWNSDSASSLPVCSVMMGIAVGAGVAVIMLATRLQSFYVQGPSLEASLLVVAGILGAGMFVQGTCEWMSGRVFGVVMFLLWMVPFFTMAVIAAAFDEMELGMLVGMPCPPVMLFASISVMLDSTTPLAGTEVYFIPPESEFTGFGLITQIGVYGYFAAGVGAQLWRWRHRAGIRRAGMSEGPGEVSRMASDPEAVAA